MDWPFTAAAAVAAILAAAAQLGRDDRNAVGGRMSLCVLLRCFRMIGENWGNDSKKIHV